MTRDPDEPQLKLWDETDPRGIRPVVLDGLSAWDEGCDFGIGAPDEAYRISSFGKPARERG